MRPTLPAFFRTKATCNGFHVHMRLKPRLCSASSCRSHSSNIACSRLVQVGKRAVFANFFRLNHDARTGARHSRNRTIFDPAATPPPIYAHPHISPLCLVALTIFLFLLFQSSRKIIIILSFWAGVSHPSPCRCMLFSFLSLPWSIYVVVCKHGHKTK